MHAIDDLGDALETTRNLLTPIRWRLWLKLAIVVFFVSSLGLGGAPASGGDIGTVLEDPTLEPEPADEEVSEEIDEEIPAEFWIVVLFVLGILFLLGVLYQLVGAVMEFVFVESLRSSAVHIRRYFGANLGNGIRLFLFRVGLWLLFGALAAVPAIGLFAGGLDGVSNTAFAAYALYGIGLYVLYTIVARFTSAFVVPVMLLEDRAVLSAWSRFWSTFTANWSEYVVYLLLVWILSLAISIAAGFVTVFGIIALLIPFGIVVVLLVLLGDIGILLAIPVGLLAIAAILLFVSLVWMPITTYFQYYALLILGDTNPDLDLIPDQRAAVRGGDGASSGYAGPGGEPDGWSSDEDDSWDDSSSAWDETDSLEGADPWDERDDETDRNDRDRDRDRDDPDRDRDDDRSW